MNKWSHITVAPGPCTVLAVHPSAPGAPHLFTAYRRRTPARRNKLHHIVTWAAVLNGSHLILHHRTNGRLHTWKLARLRTPTALVKRVSRYYHARMLPKSLFDSTRTNPSQSQEFFALLGTFHVSAPPVVCLRSVHGAILP